MKRSVVFVLLVLSGLCVHAAGSDAVEAWLSKSNFDGETFRFEYVLYDAASVQQEYVETSCQFGQYQGHQVVSAIQVRVMVKADFSQTGQQYNGAGSIAIRPKIEACLAQLPEADRSLRAPVRVILPNVSIPSM